MTHAQIRLKAGVVHVMNETQTMPASSAPASLSIVCESVVGSWSTTETLVHFDEGFSDSSLTKSREAIESYWSTYNLNSTCILQANVQDITDWAQNSRGLEARHTGEVALYAQLLHVADAGRLEVNTNTFGLAGIEFRADPLLDRTQDSTAYNPGRHFQDLFRIEAYPHAYITSCTFEGAGNTAGINITNPQTVFVHNTEFRNVTRGAPGGVSANSGAGLALITSYRTTGAPNYANQGLDVSLVMTRCVARDMPAVVTLSGHGGLVAIAPSYDLQQLKFKIKVVLDRCMVMDSAVSTGGMLRIATTSSTLGSAADKSFRSIDVHVQRSFATRLSAHSTVGGGLGINIVETGTQASMTNNIAVVDSVFSELQATAVKGLAVFMDTNRQLGADSTFNIHRVAMHDIDTTGEGGAMYFAIGAASNDNRLDPSTLNFQMTRVAGRAVKSTQSGAFMHLNSAISGRADITIDISNATFYDVSVSADTSSNWRAGALSINLANNANDKDQNEAVIKLSNIVARGFGQGLTGNRGELFGINGFAVNNSAMTVQLEQITVADCTYACGRINTDVIPRYLNVQARHIVTSAWFLYMNGTQNQMQSMGYTPNKDVSLPATLRSDPGVNVLFEHITLTSRANRFPSVLFGQAVSTGSSSLNIQRFIHMQYGTLYDIHMNVEFRNSICEACMQQLNAAIEPGAGLYLQVHDAYRGTVVLNAHNLVYTPREDIMRADLIRSFIHIGADPCRNALERSAPSRSAETGAESDPRREVLPARSSEPCALGKWGRADRRMYVNATIHDWEVQSVPYDGVVTVTTGVNVSVMADLQQVEYVARPEHSYSPYQSRTVQMLNLTSGIKPSLGHDRSIEQHVHAHNIRGLEAGAMVGLVRAWAEVPTVVKVWDVDWIGRPEGSDPSGDMVQIHALHHVHLDVRDVRSVSAHRTSGMTLTRAITSNFPVSLQAMITRSEFRKHQLSDASSLTGVAGQSNPCVAIEGSDVSVQDSSFHWCRTKARGGGLVLRADKAVVRDTVFSDCTATEAGGCMAVLKPMRPLSGQSMITLQRVKMMGGTTINSGSVQQEDSSVVVYGDGGLFFSDAANLELSLQNCNFTGGVASGRGGLLALGGDASCITTVTDTYLRQGEAGQGGCVAALGGIVRMERTNVRGCEASQDGGGFMCSGADTSAQLMHLNFSDVSARTNGGGLTVEGHCRTNLTNVNALDTSLEETQGVGGFGFLRTGMLDVTQSTLYRIKGGNGGLFGCTGEPGKSQLFLSAIDSADIRAETSAALLYMTQCEGHVMDTRVHRMAANAEAGLVNLVEDSLLYMKFVVMKDIEAARTGVIRTQSSSCFLENCHIHRVSTSQSGAGVLHARQRSDIRIWSSILDDMRGVDSSAVYLTEASSMHMYNTTVRSGVGAGVHCDGCATLNVNQVTFWNISGGSKAGGGMRVTALTQRLYVQNTDVLECSSNLQGSGVEAGAGIFIGSPVEMAEIKMRNVRLLDNTMTGGQGGGLGFVESGVLNDTNVPVLLDNVLIEGNTALAAGGLMYSAFRPFEIRSSEIKHNQATLENGGGLSLLPPQSTRGDNAQVAPEFANVLFGPVYFFDTVVRDNECYYVTGKGANILAWPEVRMGCSRSSSTSPAWDEGGNFTASLIPDTDFSTTNNVTARCVLPCLDVGGGRGAASASDQCKIYDLRNCPLGWARQTDQKCSQCERGQYSLTPDAANCYSCPNNADCGGDGNIVAKTGFWPAYHEDDGGKALSKRVQTVYRRSFMKRPLLLRCFIDEACIAPPFVGCQVNDTITGVAEGTLGDPRLGVPAVYGRLKGVDAELTDTTVRYFDGTPSRDRGNLTQAELTLIQGRGQMIQVGYGDHMDDCLWALDHGEELMPNCAVEQMLISLDGTRCLDVTAWQQSLTDNGRNVTLTELMEAGVAGTYHGCALGYVGPLCHRCDKGYSRTGLYECDKCRPKWFILMTLIGALTLFMCLNGFLVWRTIQSAARNAGSTIVVKSALSHGQFIMFAASMAITWPVPVVRGIGILTTLSGADLFSGGCLFNISEDESIVYYDTLVVLTFPFVGALLTASVIGLIKISAHLYAKHKAKKQAASQSPYKVVTKPTAKAIDGASAQEAEAIAARSRSFFFQFGQSMIVLFFLLHPTLVRRTTMLFACRSLAEAGEYGGGGDNDELDAAFEDSYVNRAHLSADYSVECWAGAHPSWAYGVGVPAMAIYGFGIPLAGFLLVYFNRKHLGKPETRQKFGFLYNGYRIDHKWAWAWDSIVLTRKFGFVLLILLLQEYGGAVQAFVAQIWLLIFYVLHTGVKPYDREHLQSVEGNAILAEMFIMTGGMFMTMRDHQDVDMMSVRDWALWVIFVPNGVFIIYVIRTLFRSTLKAFCPPLILRWVFWIDPDEKGRKTHKLNLSSVRTGFVVDSANVDAVRKRGNTVSAGGNGVQTNPLYSQSSAAARSAGGAATASSDNDVALSTSQVTAQMHGSRAAGYSSGGGSRSFLRGASDQVNPMLAKRLAHLVKPSSPMSPAGADKSKSPSSSGSGSKLTPPTSPSVTVMTNPLKSSAAQANQASGTSGSSAAGGGSGEAGGGGGGGGGGPKKGAVERRTSVMGTGNVYSNPLARVRANAARRRSQMVPAGNMLGGGGDAAKAKAAKSPTLPSAVEADDSDDAPKRVINPMMARMAQQNKQ